ncbi:MAG TPA: hypothetical protein VFB74_35075 [Kribbellaceae bacterium]|nr:hypothetical protein [Kribbellaceae bacterium]
MLPGQTQDASARRQDVQRWAPTKQTYDEVSDRIDEVFAGVQDEEAVVDRQGIHEHVLDRTIGLRAHTCGRRDR